MSYIKTFEKFEENIEDDYDHFNGIDISDLSFSFFWNYIPCIEDVSQPGLGIEFFIKKYLVGNVSKETFCEILIEEGFHVNIGNEFTSGDRAGDYVVHVDSENVRHFFDIIKNLKYLI